MDKVRQISALINKDLKESLRNKTILIVIILPLAASLLFSLVNSSQLKQEFKLGIINQQNEKLSDFIEENSASFQVKNYQNNNDGHKALKAGLIDCLLIKDTAGSNYFVYLGRQNPAVMVLLKDRLEDIITAYLKIKPQFKLKLIPIFKTNYKYSFLPVWITVTIIMIGVLIISGNLAEEKDNRTFDALLISPLGQLEMLIAKGLFGVIITVFTVLLMGLLNGIYHLGISLVLLLLAVILIGSFSFITLGLLIGLVTESQSAARAIGTVIYFPLLFPALIKDISPLTRKIAKFFPSYYLQDSLEKLLLYQTGYKQLWFNLMILLLTFIIIAGLLFLFNGYRLHDFRNRG